MNSEEIHLKSWSNKIQEMYKMFLGSQTFRSNITSIRMTLQYKDNGVFFSSFSCWLCTVDQASFSNTMQWHGLHNIAK